MAVESMKMVSILGKFNKLDSTIEAYLDSGCFHPESASSFVSNVKGFTSLNEENPYGSYLNKLTNIIESSGFVPKIIDNPGQTDSLPVLDEKINKLEERVGALINQRAKIEEQIKKNKSDAEDLAHFENLDVSISDTINSKYVKFRFGKLPKDSFDKLKFYNSNPYIAFHQCSLQDDFIWGMYVAPASESKEVDAIFNSLFFERLRIPDFDGTPKQAIESINLLTADLVAKKSELNEIINEYSSLEKDDYFKLYSQLKRSFDACEIRKYATKYGDSFVLLGWIPESEQEKFESYMNKVDAIEYTYSNPDEDSSIAPPIKLKNLKIFKPFEYYVEMFGVPGYNEIDPTPFMAIVYTLLFGIMFADFGQGLIVALVGYLMYKIKGMKIGPILIPCGIASSIFGLVFGSVFGFEELLDPIYESLGIDFLPIKVMTSSTGILLVAVALGIVMIMSAIVLNIYSLSKQKKFGNALFSENGLCGLLAYASIIAIILSIVFPIPSWAELIIIITLAASLVLIMFKEPLSHIIETKSKFKPEGSVGEFVMQSIFEMFEAFISYITNTVSFMRIGAFVIIHAGMMLVFFILAGMMPNTVLYWIMVIFGNIFVSVLEALLVSVQSLRLLFYELFSRFYTGDGKAYEPAKIGEYNND